MLGIRHQAAYTIDRSVAPVRRPDICLEARCMMQCRKYDFTLVELLAVVVIMLIVLGISGPALTKVFMGSSVDSSARMVGAQLRLARQYAITQRKHIAVVFPSANGPWNDDDKKYQAMRPCEVDASENFLTWVPNTKWTYLPQGAVIYAIDDNSAASLVGSGDRSQKIKASSLTPYESTASARDYDYVSATGGDCRAIIFRPSGGLQLNGNGMNRYLYILEGASTGANVPLLRNRDKDDQDYVANWVEIEIKQYTGRVGFSRPEQE